MKKVLLIGFGSEIGANLILQNDPKKDKFFISTVVTNIIKTDKNFPKLDGMDALKARVLLLGENPSNIQIDKKNDFLIIKGRKIKIIWGDIKKLSLRNLSKKFEITIIASSKEHLKDKNIHKKLLSCSKYVVGVAENINLPAIYPSLINLKSDLLLKRIKKINKERIFAIGSCQSNGWQAQLRAILEIQKNMKLKSFDIHAMEVDIVHPDTPTGMLSNKSFSPRMQDARNNLRPSFSQLAQSMKRIFPLKYVQNSVSLRTLIEPPGFQISRFFIKYNINNNKKITHKNLIDSFKLSMKKNNNLIYLSDLPLGSKAFSNTLYSSVILTDKKYLKIKNNFSYDENGHPIDEVIIQSYVHNTIAYCDKVKSTVKYLLFSKKKEHFINEFS